MLVAELALTVSLATVLDLFRIPLPYLLYGGSLSLEGLPIVLTALRRGWRAGALAGVVYGVVSFLIKPIVVHPAQLLLDYPVAYGLLGLGSALTVGGVAGMSGPNWQLYTRLTPASLTYDPNRQNSSVVMG